MSIQLNNKQYTFTSTDFSITGYDSALNYYIKASDDFVIQTYNASTDSWEALSPGSNGYYRFSPQDVGNGHARVFSDTNSQVNVSTQVEVTAGVLLSPQKNAVTVLAETIADNQHTYSLREILDKTQSITEIDRLEINLTQTNSGWNRSYFSIYDDAFNESNYGDTNAVDTQSINALENKMNGDPVIYVTEGSEASTKSYVILGSMSHARNSQTSWTIKKVSVDDVDYLQFENQHTGMIVRADDTIDYFHINNQEVEFSDYEVEVAAEVTSVAEELPEEAVASDIDGEEVTVLAKDLHSDDDYYSSFKTFTLAQISTQANAVPHIEKLTLDLSTEFVGGWGGYNYLYLFHQSGRYGDSLENNLAALETLRAKTSSQDDFDGDGIKDVTLYLTESNADAAMHGGAIIGSGSGHWEVSKVSVGGEEFMRFENSFHDLVLMADNTIEYIYVASGAGFGRVDSDDYQVEGADAEPAVVAEDVALDMADNDNVATVGEMLEVAQAQLSEGAKLNSLSLDLTGENSSGYGMFYLLDGITYANHASDSDDEDVANLDALYDLFADSGKVDTDGDGNVDSALISILGSANDGKFSGVVLGDLYGAGNEAAKSFWEVKQIDHNGENIEVYHNATHNIAVQLEDIDFSVVHTE